MAGRIVIDTERCKGCGLCISTCPRQRIAAAKASNRNGFFPAEARPLDCSGCALCAIVCPDTAIKVYIEPAITEVKSNRQARKAVGVLKEKP